MYRKSITIFLIILFAFGYIGCAGTQKKEVSDKKKAEALQTAHDMEWVIHGSNAHVPADKEVRKP